MMNMQSRYMPRTGVDQAVLDEGLRSHMLRVYNYMASAVLLSGIVAYAVAVTRIVLRGALPGIVTGIMLSLGRCIGETAAVIFTAGSALTAPTSLFASGRTLAVHFYILAREGISAEMAYGTAAVLMISILTLNVLAYGLMHRIVPRFS